MNTALKNLASLPAAALTDIQINEALGIVVADPRVKAVSYVGRVLQDRPAFKIVATDTAEGDLVGTFTVGRVLHALSETGQEHADRVGTIRKTESASRAQAEMERPIREAAEAERRKDIEADLARMAEAGISQSRISHALTCMMNGAHMGEELTTDLGWYEENIVRGRWNAIAAALGREEAYPLKSYLPDGVGH